MGAFFLYRNDSTCDVAEARKVFVKKGFDAPYEATLNQHRLLLYRKQNVDSPNYYSKGVDSIYSIGTVVYKGKSYKDSLVSILEDSTNNQLNANRLLGNYVIILYIDNRIQILTDPMNIAHVFFDSSRTYLTSSWIAALRANGRCSVNITALIEKLLLGYITGPETLASEVFQLTADNKKDFEGISFQINDYKFLGKGSTENFKECVSKQVSEINGYFASIKNLAEEYGIEQGLSGGYDSRLLYGSALKNLGGVASVHSHSTSNIHDKELEIVREITKKHKTNLIVEKTKHIIEHNPDEIEKILKENVYYYDGRNANTIGVFSATHTRDYKTKTMRHSRLTLSGIGGEIYRNFYHTALPWINFEYWMDTHAFNIGSISMISPKRTLLKVRFKILRKIEQELNLDLRGCKNSFSVRRYFSESRIRNCLASVCNANNQVSFFLAPFTESRLIDTAYTAKNAYLGLNGKLETAMISEMSQYLANAYCSRGYKLNEVPLKRVAISFFKSYSPMFICKYRNSKFSSKKFYKNQMSLLLEKSPYFLEVYTYVKSQLRDVIDFPFIESGSVEIGNIVFTFCILFEMKGFLFFKIPND